jgi:hypothetical protein
MWWNDPAASDGTVLCKEHTMDKRLEHLTQRLQKDQRLLEAIKAHLPELENCLEGMIRAYEDRLYRLYYQSFKVYDVQNHTAHALNVFRQIAQAVDGRLSAWFEEIVAQGMGVQFDMEHNKNWLVHTCPIVEAFLHAKYFVEMMVKYGRTMDMVGQSLPSGWAAILVLYTQR